MTRDARSSTGVAKRSVDVGASNEIAERGRIVFEVDGVELGVFRFKGRLFAYANYCQHAGGPVCQGVLVPRVVEVLDEDKASCGARFSEDEMHVVCPWHGYEYNIETGAHPIDERIRLRSYAVSEIDGRVVVEFD